MSQVILQRQTELPSSIPLLRYIPKRHQFDWKSWDPTKVSTTKDLPCYLILGALDESSFEKASQGWSALWRGIDEQTHFEIKYLAKQDRYEINQKWCDINGRFGIYPSKLPLGKIVPTLYMQFPPDWDRKAKDVLERKYQITYLEQPAECICFCGIPDGTFKTIAFPVAIQNLRPVWKWLQKIINHSSINYPISVEAKLLFQAINYLEGKAPDWTTKELVVFKNSLDETGIMPYGFPVRETANDGSSAWTLRRDIYVLFLGVPFAGLTNFIERLAAADGPIRTREDTSIRIEFQPFVIPAALEFQSHSIAYWDKEQTTRCIVQFSKPGKTIVIPSINDIIYSWAVADDLLQKAETISVEVYNEIQQIWDRNLNK